MTRKTIPLKGGAVNAHQQFEVQLGDTLVTFEIDYRTLTERWTMNLLVEGERIVNGASLTPGSDIIEHWHTGLGRMIFTGEPVTLDNLGVANKLVWISPDE